MPNKPRKLFSLENMVGTMILSFFTWVVLTLFSVKEAVAIQEVKQVVDDQVNAEVFKMHETLIRVDENVKTIKSDQQRLEQFYMNLSEK